MIEARFCSVGAVLDPRHGAEDRRHVLRAGAPGDDRRQVGGVQLDPAVELGALVAVQRLPVTPRLVPKLALRRLRAILEVSVGLLVGGDHAGARAALDRHVADRHPAFHREGLDRRAAIFDHVAGAARRPDFADDGEDDVLGGHARRKRAVDLDPHVLGLGLDQRLGGEHMLDFRSADAVGERAEGAVGRKRGCRRTRSSSRKT